jgi:hypothetical protein
MTKLQDIIYLTLDPSRFDSSGQPREFRVSGMRKTPPATRSGEVAVKIKLMVDSSLFAEYLPEAVIEIDERAVLPRVEVIVPDLGDDESTHTA